MEKMIDKRTTSKWMNFGPFDDRNGWKQENSKREASDCRLSAKSQEFMARKEERKEIKH